MKILKSTVIEAATIQMEDWERVTLKTGMPSCGKLKTKRTDIQQDHYKMPRNITSIDAF
jgi:hypothetical protein